MALISYPYESLPSPHFSSGIKQHPNLLVTKMTSGRVRTRKRFGRVPADLSIRWRLTDSEAEFFMGWVDHALSGGVAPFLLNIRLPGGVRSCEVKLLSHPNDDIKPSGSSWEFVAKISLKVLPVMSEEDVVGVLLSPNTVAEFVDGVTAVFGNY